MQVPVWPLVRRAAALHWPRGDARMARWAVPGRDGKEGFSIPQVPAWPPVRRAAPLRWPRYGDILFSAAVRFPPCPSGGEWCSAGAQSSAPRALAARPAPLTARGRTNQRILRLSRRTGAQINAFRAPYGVRSAKAHAALSAVRFPPCPSGGGWCSAARKATRPAPSAALGRINQRILHLSRRAGAQISASCASHGAQAHKSTHSAPLTACGV